MEQRNYIARTSGLRGKDYVGYALVDTAGCLIFSLVTTLLQKYYTDILGAGEFDEETLSGIQGFRQGFPWHRPTEGHAFCP